VLVEDPAEPRLVAPADLGSGVLFLSAPDFTCWNDGVTLDDIVS
jgi:hypothetical protein